MVRRSNDETEIAQVSDTSAGHGRHGRTEHRVIADPGQHVEASDGRPWHLAQGAPPPPGTGPDQIQLMADQELQRPVGAAAITSVPFKTLSTKNPHPLHGAAAHAPSE